LGGFRKSGTRDPKNWLYQICLPFGSEPKNPLTVELNMSDSPMSERRQRKPRQNSSASDKKIKIKLTAGREAHRDRDHSGSEDELEPDGAVEEQFILRMPPGEACAKLRDMVRRRDVTDDVKFVFKGKERLCQSAFDLPQ